MEPVTHMLTGACLSRAGFNRKTAYATLAMVIAAEAPDLDMLWKLRGPVEELQHHRGITHTFLGAPFMALGTLLFIFLLTRVRRKRTVIPIRWGWLYLGVFVADLSHILLDYTTNYGVRPFFPFSPRWYNWSIVSIFDVFLFLALVLALVMPAILGLADQEIGARRTRFRGRGWAWAALIFMCLWWAVRNAEHAHAEALLRNGSYIADPISRVAAEPRMADPFHWDVLIDTPDAYRTADVHTLHDDVELNPQPTYKPPVTPAVAAAKQSYLGRVYLGWSTWPVTRDFGNIGIPGAPPPPAGQDWHAVQFRDMRYGFGGILTHLDPERHAGPAVSNPPLSGWVYVGPQQEIEGMYMQGLEQKPR